MTSHDKRGRDSVQVHGKAKDWIRSPIRQIRLDNACELSTDSELSNIHFRQIFFRPYNYQIIVMPYYHWPDGYAHEYENKVRQQDG